MSQIATVVTGPTSVTDSHTSAPRSRWDRLGIIASMGCVVHCLAAPFLLLLLPTFGSLWSHPAAHWVLAALVLPLAGVVVWRGYRLHRKRSALIAMGLGAALIVAGLILPAFPADGGTTVSADASFADQSVDEFIPISATSAQVDPAAGDTGLGSEAPSCTNPACCPTITHDAETGSLSMSIPPAGIVTLIGSVFLVVAHGINLWGCRCFSTTVNAGAGSCGCPTDAAVSA